MHTWVRIKYAVLDVEARDNGILAIFIADSQALIEEEGEKTGCWFCHMELTTETFVTECDGEPKIN